MSIKGILQQKGRTVCTISDEALVCDALKLMDDHQVGALVVVNSAKGAVGIVTEKLILQACYRSSANVKSIPIVNIMTKQEDIAVGRVDDEIEVLMNVMIENRVRHVPIVDDAGKVSGIISIGDIIKNLLSDKNYEIRYLKDYIQDKYPV